MKEQVLGRASGTVDRTGDDFVPAWRLNVTRKSCGGRP
ncbi:hypothetical protein SLI_5038 [Streptomyces lividans 1326]|uniref:Uncharacterized protein n=1 Tax=Streptomyces lividans 1326 TaxID=1200984 RepID=A0A7U9DY16_STRLI|nr:hypothetical protein SLI_5038 [Streptomyces lividans 1326]